MQFGFSFTTESLFHTFLPRSQKLFVQYYVNSETGTKNSYFDIYVLYTLSALIKTRSEIYDATGKSALKFQLPSLKVICLKRAKILLVKAHNFTVLCMVGVHKLSPHHLNICKI